MALGAPVRIGQCVGHTSVANGVAKRSREIEAGESVGAAELREKAGERPERPLAELAARRKLDEVPIHAELDRNVDQQQIDVVLTRDPRRFSERV